MYIVSNKVLFHGAETAFTLPICKAYSALKVWASKNGKKNVLRLEYIRKKQHTSLFLYSPKKEICSALDPGNKSHTKNSFILPTKHHSNTSAPAAQSGSP